MDKRLEAVLRDAVESRCRPNIDDIDAQNILFAVDDLRAELNLMQDQLSASEIANEEAEHRRRAAEKDAERYRWLRHGDNDELILMLYTTGGAYLPRNENLDVAIDAAIGEQHGT